MGQSPISNSSQSNLSRQDRTCLWWLLEQAVWSIQDLTRFAHYTGTLSDIDRDVLLPGLKKIENVIKAGRIQEDAIPTQR